MSPNLGIARALPVGALRRGAARSVDAGSWRVERALRYAIGWFDYDGADDLSPEMEGSGGEGLDSDAPLADAARILRHLAVVLQPPLLAPGDADDILTWPSPLLPYQRQGVMALLSRRALLLADSMGLGKTIQAIAALRVLFHRREIASALIVCPAGLIIQWRRELARWSPELTVVPVSGDGFTRGHLWPTPAHVKLVGYETLRADVLDQRDSPALRRTWDVVILDEASRIKNRRSSVAVACKLLPRDRRWLLTGTPVENRIEDAASLLDFLLLDPTTPRSGKAVSTGQPDRSTPSRVIDESTGPAVNGRAPSTSDISTPAPITPANNAPAPAPTTPAELRPLLFAHQLRRRLTDVLPELPPKRIHEIVIELPSAQREAYDRAERDGIVQLTSTPGSVTIAHVLELISRLKQICNHDPASGESAKLTDMVERLRTISADGQRALVFSQFTDDTFGIGHVAHVLREFQPLVYTGALTQGQRAAAVARFIARPEHKALLLSLRAGGLGLNLQAASYVFHLDRWWNPAIEEQADSRAHRLGQTYPVTIYRYICAGTIEERIDAKLREKRQIFQDAVDDASLDIGSLLSQSEILSLVGLGGGRRMNR